MKDKAEDYYDFEIDEDSLQDDRNTLFKKISIIFLSLFLILLMISGLMGGQWFVNLIQGQVVSDKIEDFQVEVDDNISIIFDEDAYNELLYYYLDHQETEFKACLTGEIYDEAYHITGIYWPDQYAEFNKVSYISCNDDTIVSLHSHPYKHCIASEQDIATAQDYKEKNPKAIMAILCEPARLTFYDV